MGEKMDKLSLLYEIKWCFEKMVIEKHLYKNPECLLLGFELVSDLVEIVPDLNLNGPLDGVKLNNLSDEILKKMLDRLNRFDNEMNKFRKLH